MAKLTDNVYDRLSRIEGQQDRIESMLILLCEQLLEDEVDPSIALDDPIDDDLDSLNAILD